jgi:hypothetical protein
MCLLEEGLATGAVLLQLGQTVSPSDGSDQTKGLILLLLVTETTPALTADSLERAKNIADTSKSSSHNTLGIEGQH